VFFLQEKNDTGSLGVERAGDMEDRILDYCLNGIVGDRALGLQIIVCAAGLGQLKESCGGGVLEIDLDGTHLTCLDFGMLVWELLRDFSWLAVKEQIYWVIRDDNAFI
jgi:hypothetical protein